MPKNKVEKVNWKSPVTEDGGNQHWESTDGVFKLRLQNHCQGIKMPALWQLWQWRNGQWKKVHECRSAKACEKFARKLKQELEENDED